ncbi:hypothetical protein [Actinocrispum wychmicini]|uniref:hypothetical protein n=1 Tax=Actinocrispum wychmicini TaxID=1213861 RepID=UPI001404D58C|nr:hypothetical protein [Actinocrispum wychmicini]
MPYEPSVATDQPGRLQVQEVPNNRPHRDPGQIEQPIQAISGVSQRKSAGQAADIRLRISPEQLPVIKPATLRAGHAKDLN